MTTRWRGWLAHARHAVPRSATPGDVARSRRLHWPGARSRPCSASLASCACGSPSPRFAYLPIDPRLPGAVDFAQALGAAHLTELDVQIGDDIVQCHRLDYGPGGLFVFMRDQIYSELGLSAPAPPHLPVADLGNGARHPEELPRAA